MKIVKRILTIVFIFLFLVLVAGYFFVKHISNKALPDYNQQVRLSALSQDVKVLRDSLGIPHIYAQNEHDLYKATGYAMAQDRMWQMDLLRRVTTGRLSEIFGADLVKTDLLLRALRIPEKSELMWNDLSSGQQACLSAFAEGVNQYIDQHSDRLPPEFTILGYTPEPWEPKFSLNVTGYMAWDLAGSAYSAEINLYKIIQKLGMEKASELFPDYSGAKDFVYPDFNLDSALLCSVQESFEATDYLDEMGLRVFYGSNNWAVNGPKTVDGKALFANDMHLGLNAPGIWYQIHQVIEGKLNVTGLAVPGEPLVVAGHNDSIAWGMTNLYVDDIDLYLETINPEDTSQYLFNGEWKNLDIRKEVIKIKGGTQEIYYNKFTHRGPIISGFKNVAEAISMKWIGNEYSNEMKGVYNLNRSSDWDDFCDAISTFNSVSQNFVYADAAGNIGLYAGGGVPIREGANYMVKPGDTSLYDWTGRVPFKELPHVYNPDNGMVSSANNKTVDDSYPYYIGSYFAQGYRIARIRELLESKQQLDIEDFKSMQADQTSVLARDFTKEILPVLQNASFEGNKLTALELLERWNGEMQSDASQPLIFEYFYHQLLRSVLADEMGEELFNEFNTNLAKNFFENLRIRKVSAFIDDINTPDKTENFDDMIVRSFGKTIDELSTKFGPDPNEWSWGNEHQLILKHPLGKVNLLDKVFGLNYGPYKLGGSFHTVCPYSYSFTNRYAIIHGASHRHIFTPSNWENSLAVIPTGESGIPASPFYCNQTGAYIHNQYFAVPFSREFVDQAKRFECKFVP